MAAWTKDVYSFVAREIGYDPETKDLIVVWKNGRRSAYSNVPEELAVQLSTAPSVGNMLNNEIKPYFQHRYV
jgi:hypothetical protein